MLYKNIKVFLDCLPWPIWIVDTEKKIQFLNRRYEDLFDINFSEIQGKTNQEAFGAEKAAIYERQIDECINKQELLILKGEIKDNHVECYCFPIKNEEDELLAIAGIIADVNEQKSHELEIQKQKNILRTIIDSLPYSIFYKDTDSKYIGYNKTFEEFYNRRGISNIIGHSDLEIYHDRDIANSFITQDREVMIKKEQIQYEYSYKNETGDKVFEENIKIPVLNEEGHCFGVVGISHDITKRKTIEAKLRYLSEIDMLTGLYNRYSFEEKIKELNSAEHLPLGIIMGDVNGLKLVNDTLGHLEGDELLKAIAKILREACEEKGLAFRWGGDEFMMLIPNCTEAHCEEIMAEIEQKCIKADSKLIQLSISLGEVVKFHRDEDIYQCIKRVEEKVYRHKLLQKKSIKSTLMNSLVKTLEEKNMETELHTERVVELSYELGKILDFKVDKLDELVIAARLHDIGKIGVNEKILLKPDKLTDEEFEEIKQHPEIGYRIINSSSELGNIAKCVLTHHERWDGKGYPLGLKGLEIPLMARIICIADAYDVMTHDRPYRKSMSNEDAILELKRCAGTQFDPYLVEKFITYLKNQ